MSTLNLPKPDLDIIKNIIKNLYPHATIWAYGSRVNGDCHEGSDLDLVVMNFGNNTGNINKIRTAFSESNIPILIDIRLWQDLPESFKNEIKKKYIEIM